ncbi:MAG TPA: DUF6152 family protein [Vicinamibacterales bacterium]
MQLKSLILAAAICAVVLAVPTRAHHSHNAYEVTKWTNMEGVIKELHMVVPHSWVYMEVKDAKGEATLWALEAAGPNAIMNNGVKKGDVRVGDKIKVRCHLLRDGSPGCLLGFITPDHGDQARGHGVEREWD